MFELPFVNDGRRANGRDAERDRSIYGNGLVCRGADDDRVSSALKHRENMATNHDIAAAWQWPHIHVDGVVERAVACAICGGGDRDP